MKPSWDEAPQFARWLTQDRDGWWTWHRDKPYISPNGSGQWLSDSYDLMDGIPTWMDIQFGRFSWSKSIEARPCSPHPSP